MTFELSGVPHPWLDSGDARQVQVHPSQIFREHETKPRRKNALGRVSLPAPEWPMKGPTSAGGRSRERYEIVTHDHIRRAVHRCGTHTGQAIGLCLIRPQALQISAVSAGAMPGMGDRSGVVCPLPVRNQLCC